jgi:WD40 repeat protein
MGTRDGAAHVWNISSRLEIARLYHGGSVWALAFTPDGKHLATAGDDRYVRICVWHPEDLIEEASRRLESYSNR